MIFNNMFLFQIFSIPSTDSVTVAAPRDNEEVGGGCPTRSDSVSSSNMKPSIETEDYEVRECDTIEGIAASHDCTVGELVKLNKMHSRMVSFMFPTLIDI